MLQNETSTVTRSAEVIIVGGGVIGLSIAHELARRGVSDIVLCDKGELGKEASWAAGGILAPQVEADTPDDFFKLATASRDLYPSFAQTLHDETGIDVELDQTGTLFLAFSEDDEAELRHRSAWQQRTGLRVEWLNSEDARRLEPNISSAVRCALRFPDDWQIENRRLVQALIKANEKLGATLVSNCEVKSVRVDGNRVTGVHAAGGLIDAPIVIVCAGAWTSSVNLPASSAGVEIEPVRGQMLCFKPESELVRHVIYTRGGYLVPRRGGRVLAGSTSEHVGFDKRVTDDGVSSIKSIAFQIAPSLATASLVDSWAGFRPRAVDDLPVIGPDVAVDGVFYATGHYRNGILLAPVTAKLLADCVLERLKSPLLAGFSPCRLGAVTANP